MDFDAARTLAMELMDRHGLLAGGWRLRWGRGKRQLGSCTQAKKTITLSAYFVDLNDEPEVRDTILHEIAHALVGHRHGHDAVWKAMCRRLGADPTRTSHTAVMPAAPYELFCPRCQQVIARRHRRIRPERLQRLACGACGRPTIGQLVFRHARR